MTRPHALILNRVGMCIAASAIAMLAVFEWRSAWGGVSALIANGVAFGLNAKLYARNLRRIA